MFRSCSDGRDREFMSKIIDLSKPSILRLLDGWAKSIQNT